MAVDYKNLRMFRDLYAPATFAQQYNTAANKVLYQQVNTSTGFKNMSQALTYYFNQNAGSLANRTLTLNQTLNQYATQLGDINKYVTSDTSVKSITDNITNYFADLYAKSWNREYNRFTKVDVKDSEITAYLKTILPLSNTNYVYKAAANQSTANLDITGLGSIYSTKGQDAYRAELSKRLATTLGSAKLSSNLTGSLFKGDARFDENASGETLKNIGDSLFQLSKVTGNDYAASKLSQIFLTASKSGVYSSDITKYFNPTGADTTASTSYLQKSLDTLDKTATTLTLETQAAKAAEAEKAAALAKAQAEAQAQAQAKAEAEAKAKAEAQAQADAQIAALKLAQDTADKKARLTKRNTGGGTEGLSLFRQLATLGPGIGAPESEVQGKKDNLGQDTLYGKQIG
jgi:hypothetical protein